jgi:hypothetical protein
MSKLLDCFTLRVRNDGHRVKYNSILGDKLTAFAPNTTGIPYKKGKHIEIIKQLHDVSKLIDNITDISTV